MTDQPGAVAFCAMSLIFATQLTAVATAVLAALAIVTAIFALLAWLGQSGQLKLLRKQLGEQRRINTEQTKVLELKGS